MGIDHLQLYFGLFLECSDWKDMKVKDHIEIENKLRWFDIFILMSLPKVLTTSTGQPVDDNQNSVTAGEYGPVAISDFHLIDKLAHFDR